MYLTLVALLDRHILGCIGWVIVLALAYDGMRPGGAVDPVFAAGISTGCGYSNEYLCVRGGCYYRPHILRTGKARPSITQNTPTFVEIWHRTGYYSGRSVNLTRYESVRCAVAHLGGSGMADILVSLVPAMCLAGLIIVLLVFLKSPNVPYVLGEPVAENEEFEMVPTDNTEKVDPREFTIDGAASADEAEPEGDPGDGEPERFLSRRRPSPIPETNEA